MNQLDANERAAGDATTKPVGGTDIDLKSVISRIHGLTTFVRASPQRREQFKSTMTL
ncbi:hypothetical protein PtA15_7A412 [Puccinia triticina]|uniref:Uncharacterized protein n=1 Tax=Puccinia triticina TaxID=208348 RepID=A0ABY7CN83_9BASI|nr:uncharacterized protein PtA15_7A412 [Puccinia triticina]WAQ86684.1 hypothetical protein PtA15_7A412 [Puccinia triticina]